MYRLFFPISYDTTTQNISYDIAILPDDIGVICSQLWHGLFEKRFNDPLEALCFYESMLIAYKTHLPCPCEDMYCPLSKKSLEGSRIFEANFSNPEFVR